MPVTITVVSSGDYLRALKDNHPMLHGQVLEYFRRLHAEPLPREVDTLETNEPRARGRSEECYDTATPLLVALFGQGNWAGLQSLVQATTTITHADKTSIDSRYFLSSLSPRAIEQIARCTRRHGWIEAAPSVLDGTFGEDSSRGHQGHAVENLAVLRRGALGLLKAYQNILAHSRKKHTTA